MLGHDMLYLQQNAPLLPDLTRNIRDMGLNATPFVRAFKFGKDHRIATRDSS